MNSVKILSPPIKYIQEAEYLSNSIHIYNKHIPYNITIKAIFYPSYSILNQKVVLKLAFIIR